MRCIGLTREVTANPKKKPLRQIISVDNVEAGPLRLTGALREKRSAGKKSVFYFAENPDTHGRVDTVIRNILCKRKKESEMAVQKIRIKLAAYDHELVDEAATRIVETMKKSGAKISGPIPLPTEREVITILRSPHKDKDSREQFEMRTYKRIIDIYSPNAKLLDTIHLPAGVDIKIKL